MSLSAELEQLAWQTLEALSENLQSSIKETQNFASINASLVQLVKFQRSTPGNPRDKDGELNSLERKIQNLEKSLELKNQEVVNLRRELEEQQLDHENEIKQRDERISQLSRQLSENHLMKGQQEVSPRGPLIHETMNEGYDGKISSIGSEEATTFQTIIDWNCSSSSETVSEALERIKQPSQSKSSKKVLSSQEMQGKKLNVTCTESVATPWIEIDELEPGVELSGIKERSVMDWINGASVAAGSQLRVSRSCDPANGFIEKSYAESTELRSSTTPVEIENQDMESEDTFAPSTFNHDCNPLPTRYPPIPLYQLGTAPQNVSTSSHTKHKRTVHVSNLDPNIRRETLETVFQKFGTVTEISIRRRRTVFALVTFQTIAMADYVKAMTELRIGKRLCKIYDALKSIRVDGFPKNTTELILTRIFSKFGQISKVSFRGRTTAFIRFVKINSAEKAVTEMNGYVFSSTNRVLTVQLGEF